MRAEYDLDALGPGEVGKYYEAYQSWKKRQISLDPDVATEFPDSESVNRTLRRVATARRRRRGDAAKPTTPGNQHG
jgi:hypothetical protein